MNSEIKSLINRGAIFFISHSGGKDSQAMYLYLAARVPKEQLVVMHSDLPGMEWEGVQAHIKATIDPMVEFLVTRATKTFYEMVRTRQKWPSAKYRQCTSDLKTGPMNTLMRRWSKRTGKTLLVNCIGIRAGESKSRSMKNPFKLNAGLSIAGREVYDWYPIFKWTTEDVFAQIKAEGQKPHWAYGVGMTRLSCCFCIMASKGDLRTSAKWNPEKLEEIADLEREIGHTIFMERGQPVGIKQYIESKEDAPAKACSGF